MNPPPYDREHLAPLTSQAAIEERVQLLIGRAARRQIWLLFLDDEDRQLPLLVPVQDPPSQPAEDDDRKFAGLLAQIKDQTNARGLIAVLERFGGATLTPADSAWARMLADAASLSPLRLHGLLLSHARGVRWIAPDDYVISRSEAAGTA
jgi:hypothetical protein